MNTGAAVPNSTDTVIRQEDTKDADFHLKIKGDTLATLTIKAKL